MRKKNTSEVAIGIVLIIAVVIGVLIWLSSQKMAPETQEVHEKVIKRDGANNISNNEARNPIEAELSRFGLKEGDLVKKFSDTLPQDFSGPQWFILNGVCKEGGYDLEKYAMQRVEFALYATDKKYENEKLSLFVISKEGGLVCAYYVVSENSSLAAGIFSVKSPLVK